MFKQLFSCHEAERSICKIHFKGSVSFLGWLHVSCCRTCKRKLLLMSNPPKGARSPCGLCPTHACLNCPAQVKFGKK